jgi:hypothetical protein
MLLGLYGIGLLISPDRFSSFWPWPLSAFASQLYSVLYITPALGALLMFGAAASIELLAAGLTQAVGGLVPIIGVLIVGNQPNKNDWSEIGTWLWFGSFAIILLSGLGLIWQSRVRSKLEVPAEMAGSAME